MVLGRKTAPERVVTVLLKLAERIGQRDSGGWRIELPMSRSDLADYVGLTTETVSRTITRLRDEGALQISALRTLKISQDAGHILRTGD